MCLIFIANQCHPGYPLVIAANRDEFYQRPSLPAAFWKDRPDILSGIDQQAGGTWLGVTSGGKIAALTNYRDPKLIDLSAPSRGALVKDFLVDKTPPEKYLQNIQSGDVRYNPFNLLAGELSPGANMSFHYYSSIENSISTVPPGVHGLSNELLDTPWPKVEKGKAAIEALIREGGHIDPEALFEIMGDDVAPPDDRLPDTGVGLEWERCLSPMFIRTDVYGTRNTTVVLMDADKTIWFAERTFDPDDDGDLQSDTRTFKFQIT